MARRVIPQFGTEEMIYPELQRFTFPMRTRVCVCMYVCLCTLVCIEIQFCAILKFYAEKDYINAHHHVWANVYVIINTSAHFMWEYLALYFIYISVGKKLHQCT